MYDAVGNSFQQTIDLRGFNGQPVNSTSVFLDGVRVNEPDFNAVNFDLIPLETIERIEILPNASAIYGKNALGGVINIITKRGGAKHLVTGETLFGSFQRERYTINTSGPIKHFDYYANFSREIENGFRDESNARISRFFGKIGYRPTDGTDVTASYTYVKDRLLQAGPLNLAEISSNRNQNTSEGDFFEHETNFLRVNARQKLPFGFSVNGNAFYRRLAQDQFLSFGGGFLSTTTVETESKGGVLQLTHETTVFSRKNVLILGGELTRNDFNGTATSGPSKSTTDEDILALYAQDTFSIAPELVLTTGVRYDHNQINFDETLDTRSDGTVRFNRTTPRVGLTYLVVPQTSVYFNYSEGFRAPTPQEIFAFPPFTSNHNLKPARSRNYEVGIKASLGLWGDLAVALFQTDVQDEILFTCIICSGVFGDGKNRNIEDTRRRGIEVTIKGEYKDIFGGEVNYSFTEAQFRSREVFAATNIAEVGDSFPLVPKNRLSMTGNLYPRKGWTLSLTGLYVSTQFGLGDEANAFERLPGYFVLNGRASYERPVPGGRVNGFLTVNNILDAEYSTFGSASSFGRTFVPAPGIAVYAGVSYRFEGFSK